MFKTIKEHLLLSVIIALMVLSAVLFFSKRDLDKNYSKEIDELKLENDSLFERKEYYDNKIYFLGQRNNVLEKQVKIRNKRVEFFKNKYDNLLSEFNKIEAEVADQEIETIYNFLINVAYAYNNDSVYFQFNTPQVRGIYTTYLERQNLGRQNSILNYKVDEQKAIINTTNEMLSNCNRRFEICQKTNDIFQRTNDNLNKKIDYCFKELEDCSKTKRRTQIGAGIVTVLSIIAAFTLS